MTDLLLFLYPLLLIVLLLQGASLSPRGETGPRFLCPDQTGMIRAAACLCIILHHLVQHSTGYGARYAGPVTFFNDAGFLFTGIFFFFSGYGLTRSLETREGYLKTFPARRFPSVLIPFWITNLLLILAGRIWYGFWWNPLKLLGDFTGITLVNSNGWFIIEITLFYALFWFFFTFIRRRDAALALLSLAVLLTILFAFFRGHDPQGHAVHWFRGEWWYNSTPVFLFGLVFGRFRDRIEAFFRRHYPAVLFAAVFRVSVRVLKRYGYYYTSTPAGLRGAGLTLLFQSLAALLFALLILLLSMKVTLRSPVMSYISGISLELFLLHGFWIDPVFYEARMPDMAFFGLVLVCSIAAASLPRLPWRRRSPKRRSGLQQASFSGTGKRRRKSPLPWNGRISWQKKKPDGGPCEKGSRCWRWSYVFCSGSLPAGALSWPDVNMKKSWPPYNPRGSAKKYITVILKQTGSRSGKNACPGSS